MKYFKMHLNETMLREVEKQNNDFVKEYRECGGVFKMEGEPTPSSVRVRRLHPVEHNRFWYVTPSNGKVVDEIEVKMEKIPDEMFKL